MSHSSASSSDPTGVANAELESKLVKGWTRFLLRPLLSPVVSGGASNVLPLGLNGADKLTGR